MSLEPPDDPLGLRRPAVTAGPGDRVLGVLGDLGLSPRAAAIGAALCLAGLLGWWWLRTPAPPPAEAGLPLVTAPTSAAVPTPGGGPPGDPVGGELFAHAAGAVRRPGLYSLADGDRVADLLRAAGGPTRAADLDRINLAAPVADGSQVMVPRRGEPAPPLPTEPGDPAGLPAPVDVNRAGPEELETLPGVGPATAAAIIEFREANGGFATVEDLIDVPGIGEAKLAALADLVTV
jgi:competence protein ComEA